MADGNRNIAGRLVNYKNKGLDANELRKRREDENIQLRKQKRDLQVCIAYKVLEYCSDSGVL